MEPLHYKTIMLGNSGVGKTAIVERMCCSYFNDNHVPTVGAQFVSLDIFVEGKRIILEMWDTAGQEVFRSLVGFYARDAKGVILVADTTSSSAISDLEKWTTFLKDQVPEAKVILFGNKIDLDILRAVEEKKLRKYALKNEFDYIEGSAKTGQNVEEAFTLLAEKVSCRDIEQTTEIKIIDEEIPVKKEQGCC